MKFVDFFADNVKPYTVRGKRMLNPADTGVVGMGVSCIREYDVNLWLYTKGDTTIAIDSGYKNYKYIDDEFSEINIDPKSISAVFMTHVDVDHGGGMDKNSRIIFPNADIYLGKNDEVYLTNSTHRFSLGFLKVKNSVKFKDGYRLIKSTESINIGGISVHPIAVPGHTMGHTCYLVDDRILFTGDSLVINKNGGYCLFDFFNVDTQLNIKSLNKLKEYAAGKPIEMVCTGHSGYTCNIDHVFDHIDEVATSSKKKPFDNEAPYNVFKK